MTTNWSAIDDGFLNPAWYADGDPYDIYEMLRTEDPVHWAQPSSFGRPFWVVTRYTDVVDVLQDAANYSNYRDTRPPREARRLTTEQLHASGDDANLNHMDPPLHTFYRRPMESHFSAESIGQLRDSIASVTAELIAEAQTAGRTDFVSELAADLPMHVIMRFLGVPREDWEWLRSRVWESFAPADPRYAVAGQDPATTMTEASQAIADYTSRLAAAKRAQPADDFASTLTRMVVDGTRLDHHEVSAWLSLLVAASLETTRNTAGIGLWLLHQNPQQRRLLIERPDLMGRAVDEILRWASPVRSRLRVARFDTTLGGKNIAAGDWVVPILSSANRDETVFEDPHAFDIARPQKPNLSLGEGIHKCLALHLVKLELGTLFTQFLAAFPDFEIVDPDRPAWVVDHVLNGFSSLQVRLHA